MIRTCVVAGTYASLVSLLSLGGSWGLPLAAAPFASVEAPSSTRPAAGAAAGQDAAKDQAGLPVRAAHVERRDARGGLGAAAAAIAADRGAVWLAWTVPAVRRDGDDSRPRKGRHDGGRDCVLEEDGHFVNGSSTEGDTTELVVLARLQTGGADRLTFTDARCTVQAGNRTVYFLEQVRPADSVAWVANLAGRDRGLRDTALAVIALTGDPSADRTLEQFVAPDRPSELRRNAAFWLGSARGAPGAAVIDRLARTDRDEQFREHLMFVLTLTGDAGLERLIDRARNDESSGVRSQALFWLAQKAGEGAAGTLARAVDEDPDSEVRQRAVFAISQLPKDEGVPKLIALAETHRDREVRRQAMFWLGQSGDPRALAFFEQVLSR